MNALPPWKLAEREEWAEARPWLAGFYFGLLMSLFSAVYPMIIGGTEQLYLAAIVGLASWPLFAVGVKHRWGQRPDAKAHPPPTYRRRWSRASDTWLSWFMWTGGDPTSVLSTMSFPARPDCQTPNPAVHGSTP